MTNKITTTTTITTSTTTFLGCDSIELKIAVTRSVFLRFGGLNFVEKDSIIKICCYRRSGGDLFFLWFVNIFLRDQNGGSPKKFQKDFASVFCLYTELSLHTIGALIYCCLPTMIWWKSALQVFLSPPHTLNRLNRSNCFCHTFLGHNFFDQAFFWPEILLIQSFLTPITFTKSFWPVFILSPKKIQLCCHCES